MGFPPWPLLNPNRDCDGHRTSAVGAYRRAPFRRDKARPHPRSRWLRRSLPCPPFAMGWQSGLLISLFASGSRGVGSSQPQARAKCIRALWRVATRLLHPLHGSSAPSAAVALWYRPHRSYDRRGRSLAAVGAEADDPTMREQAGGEGWHCVRSRGSTRAAECRECVPTAWQEVRRQSPASV